jgi:WS/DGAT/MGAT family acyltransferase
VRRATVGTVTDPHRQPGGTTGDAGHGDAAGGPPYQRLTTLDASFLHLESSTTPMHIGSLAVLDGASFFDEHGGFRLDSVRRQVASRLHLLPRFRRRVQFVPLGQGRPVWVDDAAFDIADHVRLVVLPPPGNRAQLVALCERLHMRLLDRRRPLWELWFVGGLDDGNVALFQKLHHALVDGVSGVDVAAVLFDLEPGSEAADAGPTWHPVPAPSAQRLLLDAWLERARQPLELAQAGVRAAWHGPWQLGRTALQTSASLAGLVRPDHRASSSSLNRRVGPHRRLVTVDESLDAVHRAAHLFDATVNDVVLAAVTGGLRRLLVRRSEPVHKLHLRVLVPVSVRADGEHGDLGNKVTSLFVPLPVEMPSAIERLDRVRRTMASLKDHNEADGNEVLLEATDYLPPNVTAALSRMVHHQSLVNVVVTNIPGPARPLYFMGAEVLEVVPVVPLGGNLTVGIAVLSYRGSLTIAVHADPDACPDLEVLVQGIRDEFDELFVLAGVSRDEAEPPTPHTL